MSVVSFTAAIARTVECDLRGVDFSSRTFSFGSSIV